VTTPTASVRVLRNSARLLTARALGVTVQLVYLLVVARVLPGIELAALPVMNILNEVCTRLSDLGLTSTCVQRGPELLSRGEHRQAAAMARTAALIPFLIAWFVAAVLFWQADAVAVLLLKDVSIAPIVRLICLGIAGYRLRTTCLLLLQAWQRFGLLGALRVGNNLVRLLSLGGYWLAGIEGLLATLVLGQWLLALVALVMLRDVLFSEATLVAPLQLARYSAPYYLNGFVRFGTMQADQLLVGVALLPEQLATYYVIRQLFDFLVMYVDTLIDSFLPRLSELRAAGRDRVIQAFRWTSRFLAVAVIPLCCIMASLSYPLLQVYGGAKYLSANMPLATLALAALFYTSYSYYGAHVYALGRPMEHLGQESVGGLLNVGFGLLLMSGLGIQGFALARLLSLLGATLFSASLLRRSYPVRLDRQALGRVLWTVLVGCVVIVGGQLLFYRLWLVPVYGLLGGVVFVLLYSRYLRDEDVALFESGLPAPLYRATIQPLVRLRNRIWGEKGYPCDRVR
jgi:O-antigen/teichoic acid export membrane protein